METPYSSLRCPLCSLETTRHFGNYDARSYHLCPRCRLIFVPESFWPTLEDERARYDSHQNSIGNGGYISFLEKLATPMAGRLKPGARGLDYGCGPVPALCHIFDKKGLTSHPYDPFYFPQSPLGPFDFITSSETFEHFCHPNQELKRLRKLLLPGGFLGVMTEFWNEATFSNNWHYRRDFTHICFYRFETMVWIGETFGFDMVWCDGKRVTIFRRT